MKASELRDQSPEDMDHQLSQLRNRLFQLRTEFHTDEQPDTSEKGKIRKDIARIKTISREREMESGKENDDATLAENGAVK